MNLIRDKKRFIFLMILILVEVLMTVTQTGYLMIGNVSTTLLHIPVCLAIIVLGLPAGLLLGGIFGLSSMLTAIWFIPDGTLDALFRNPLLSILPRLLFPVVIWLVYRGIQKLVDDHTLSGRMICGGFASLCGALSNSLFVLISAILLYPEQLKITDNLSANAIIVDNLIQKNLLYEIVITVLVTWVTVFLCDRLGVLRGSENREQSRHIRKTFQKWLFLFVVLITVLVMNFLFIVLTVEGRNSSQSLLRKTSKDMLVYVIQNESAVFSKKTLTLGDEGVVLIIRDGVIRESPRTDDNGLTLADLGIRTESIKPGECFETELDGVTGLAVYYSADKHMVCAFIPLKEVYSDRNRINLLMYTGLLIVSLLLYFTISRLVQGNVVHKVQQVNESLKKICAGNLDEKVQVGGNLEFEELSEGINRTVAALKEHIAREAARIDQELAYASIIQTSALPPLDGPVTEQPAFLLNACMDTAREVGGDFYDFYLTENHKLVFLIADVSGKGIPAAMFMMRGKAILRDCALNTDNIGAAFSVANRRLCEGNETGMFITGWMGILDPDSGEVNFSSAGHNPPVLIRNGIASYLQMPPGLVLAVMEEMEYTSQSLTLEEGDVLFLYTDGVTEAANRADELFGDDRLLRTLSEPWSDGEDTCRLICQRVMEAVDAFADGAPQADDITMLCLRYRGPSES